MAGRYFIPRKPKPVAPVVPVIPGYKRIYVKPHTLKIEFSNNPTVFVSAAILNVKHNYDTYGGYLTKLPLLMINTSRLAVTIMAFKSTDKALCFYINTDLNINQCESNCDTISSTIHRLRSSGYIEYWTSLAVATNLNLEIIDSCNPIKYINPTAENYLKIHQDDDNQWFASVEQTPTYN